MLNAADKYRTLEELSATTAPQRVHPGAVYLHQGETFLVTEYNCDMRHAIVQPAHVDYYTQPRELNDVQHRALATAPVWDDRRLPGAKCGCAAR